MGPESHSAESYISAVAPIFFGHCVLDRLQVCKHVSRPNDRDASVSDFLQNYVLKTSD